MEALINELVVITNDIYTQVGPGYNEIIYHRAFEVALRTRSIPYQSEVVTPVMYNNHVIGHGRVDIIVNNLIIIELKAIANLNNNDPIIQIKNYMKQHNIINGLIINFGQCNSKNLNGSISIKYINGETLFIFENGVFNTSLTI
jgi:GxxExxY protein